MLLRSMYFIFSLAVNSDNSTLFTERSFRFNGVPGLGDRGESSTGLIESLVLPGDRGELSTGEREPVVLPGEPDVLPDREMSTDCLRAGIDID